GSEYVPYILALMQVESGGRGGDPMQSSESLGLPPNTIQDPVRSIEQGVKFFIQNVKGALAQGVDLHTALQA
ncbi:lysozyme family protein, partial [Enterococcus gallinarum]